jgi:TctA family transporter
MVLGIILGPMAESGFRQSMALFPEARWMIFFGNNGISIILEILLIVVFLMPMWLERRRKSQQINNLRIA